MRNGKTIMFNLEIPNVPYQLLKYVWDYCDQDKKNAGERCPFKAY